MERNTTEVKESGGGGGGSGKEVKPKWKETVDLKHSEGAKARIPSKEE